MRSETGPKTLFDIPSVNVDHYRRLKADMVEVDAGICDRQLSYFRLNGEPSADSNNGCRYCRKKACLVALAEVEGMFNER